MAASLQQMMLRSQKNGSPSNTTLITAFEAEQLIEQLQATTIEQVGSSKFMKQHDAISKLNLQAHYNAQTHSDEFVLELLLSLDKLSVLVQELLVIEAWKERLLPLLKENLAEHVDSATSYVLLYHEAAVANLLEVLLFHRHACEALDEDALLELADWAVRKLTHLNSGAAHAYANAPERSVQEVLALSPLQELEDKRAETDFAAALCGLTILRYLSDHVTSLPLGLMSRLLGAHDAVMALLPLVEAPPWVRSRKSGKTEKFIDGRWQVVPPADRMKIAQLDGQVWLSLVNLLVEPACRAKYDPDEYRRGCLLKLQRHLHELLMDQLPVLRQLARVLDEMALGINNAAAAAGGAGSKLILEQVPALRERLLHGKDSRTIAKQQKTAQFGAAAKQLAQERLKGMLESFEMMCQIEQQQQLGKQHTAGAAGSSEACSLLDGGGADEAAVLAAPIRVVCSRQVAAHFMGSVAEALLQLPEVPLRSSTAADGGPPPGLWLTVGLLAADGFALQLRLKKADRPTERDRTEGTWFAYHPVGGAITVLVPPEALAAEPGASAAVKARAAAPASKISVMDTATVKP
ncbi:hypothetical protein OEZ85_008677 [Tetradesmus obliquus]|uniref:Uncharacterized protein n=1 Tax=Tetradesmus obliquus TaxID=3088 RepID=A0ABY8TJJ3_TETOB|nr:hypothetical protein OEZ85_008677 [Tetradesmus obliquus]